MSTTPRTDSNTIAGTVILHNGQCTAQMVSSSFARQLETELTSMSIISERWEADALRYAKNAEYWQSRAEKAEAELNFEREKVIVLTKWEAANETNQQIR